VLQTSRKNGGTMTAGERQKPMSELSNSGGGAGFAKIVSMVAAGKRLARNKRNRPTKSFCFNDNGSMVDLQCEDHASTFQCQGGTLPEDPPELAVVHGSEVGVEQVSRFHWRRQDEVDCWSNFSGHLGMVRPPTAEQLLAPLDGDRNSFRMWTPTPSGERESNYRLSDNEYETTMLNR